MKRFFRAFLMANQPHGKPAVDQKTPTHPLMQFHTFQSCIVMILMFSHPSSSHSYLVMRLSGLPVLHSAAQCVCVQPLTFVFTHNHRACLCPQSAALNAELDTRVVLVGMRLREKVMRSQREQLATADYSLFHTHTPHPPSPLLNCPLPRHPFCSGRGQGSDRGKAPPSGPQAFQHSSVV